MNVNFNDNINNYPLRSTNSTVKRDYTNFQNRQNQSFGSLEQVSERFANRLVANPKTQKLLKNATFNKLLKTAIENPGLYEAFIALLITCTARPLTILATPGAKMEDKEYAAAQSMASGISGLAMAYAAFGPLTKAIDNILIKVNGENVKTAFKNFYSNPENAELIAKLAERKIIPDIKTFNSIADKETNIFGYFKNYLKNNGGKAYIDRTLTGEGIMERGIWTELSQQYSNGLKKAFSEVKNTGSTPTKKYLIHETFEFLQEGAYKLKASAGADKTKFLVGGTGKIIFFPLLAGVTIWAIPKIMKIVFPNHRRSKGKANSTKPQTQTVLDYAKNTKLQNNSTLNNSSNKPAVNKQVSFAGGIGNIGKLATSAYEKCYQNPLSSFFSKILEKITFSNGFSNRINKLLENDKVKKYGMEVLSRDKSGKILSKWDNDFYASNLPQIAGIFGSCLYIFNTIRNKEIDPERKPTLCTNMAVVAIFSLLAGKAIEKASTPIFDALKKTHSGLMKNKLNYDHEAAWKCAKSLLTTTFAFRYLGPVLATPTADKLVRLFTNQSSKHSHKK